MSFPRYPRYKDSGVDWLGEVPEHWQVLRIGTLFRQVSDDGNNDLPILSVSIHDGVSSDELDEKEMDRKVTRSEDRSKYKKVAPGDLVYNMMRAWQGGFGTVSVPGMVSPAYVVARPDCSSVTPQVERLLRTPNAIEEMRRYSRGITDFRLRLYWEEFKGLTVVIPPEAERDALDLFLDHETFKIDALIAEQQRLIELLKEKRQAVISHAVTKGLNPNVRMKDSGIEWLGEVPEHWEVGPLKRYWTVTDCKHLTAEFVDDGIPLASIREVQGNWVSFESAKCTTQHFYEMLIEGGRRPEAGDLIFSRNATVGEVAQVPVIHPRFALGQDVVLLRQVSSKSSSSFMQNVLRSPVVSNQLDRMMIGSTFKRINVEEIRSLSIPWPPANEQIEIASRIQKQTERFDDLTSEAQRAIDLLQERRTALISAAVTGQIDVRSNTTNC
jgi:type I restriction enzyme S subunit